MILDVILSVVAFFFNGIATLLPTIQMFPANLSTNILSFVGYTVGWSWLFPIATIYTIFGLIVVLVLAEFTYFVAMFVFSIIHASIRG